MKLRHVTVFAIPSADSWLDGNSLEGYYYCPRCGITCQVGHLPRDGVI